MKKAVLLVLLILSFSASVYAEDIASVICEYAQPAVVTIKAGDKTGSGFFVDTAGYILTNAHVVKGEKKLVVQLANKKELDAEVAAIADKADVALVRIAQTNVPVLRLGDSSKLRQADQVLILGAPKGLSFTASRASIGATERVENGVKYIQIDGPVNPGNSGGPVVNMRGEVVGITTAMLMNAQSIGFALPIDTIYDFLKKQPVALDVSLGDEKIALQGITRKKDKPSAGNLIDNNSGPGYAIFWLVLSWASLSFNAIIILRYLSRRNAVRRRRRAEAISLQQQQIDAAFEEFNDKENDAGNRTGGNDKLVE